MQDNLDSQSHHCCKKQHNCSCRDKSQSGSASFYLLRSSFSNETFRAHFDQGELSSNMTVVCQCPYGLDILTVVGPFLGCQQQRETLSILRIANDRDSKKAKELEKKTKDFIAIFRQKIRKYPDLGMKFVNARLLLDETKVIFFFTAEQRVDFRDLVKELSTEIHTYVELWQINTREETRILGGLAVCGREYCCRMLGTCSGNISMKMLKDQSLSPNSTKLSGACGRLFCCLAYEHQQYIDEKNNLPKIGSTVVLENEKWHIKELNVIARSLILVAPSGSRISMNADELIYDAENKYWILKNLKNQN